ncbi:LacI family DNA-binding transcriptional regulator [Cognatishimia activa]|uniref:Trehalose repressor n=1 Tax=Cognatishimia activa TaxID=1715691 RepID=A0A0N7MC16_9RHOB|nr:LacI family DNA-binding transcriptional regulator [Cognatishimia activa]CUJ37841.1 trehalose repressor [Cognatishimia activa]CUK26952.1 trehalose repressor [Cognatishimia activa]
MTHRFPIKEIARQAGLGPATVDRVLNNRAHVSAQTRMRVAAAIEELEGQEAQLAAKGRRLFFDVVVEAPSRFSTEIRLAAEQVIPSIGPAICRPRFIMQEIMEEQDVIQALNRIAKRGSHGVLLKAKDTQKVRDAVDQLTSAKIPVVTLVTDIDVKSRLAYVGVNNAGAGRTAAFLISKLLRNASGKVLATRSHERFLGEEEREDAFVAALKHSHPQLDVVSLQGGSGVNRETSKLIEASAADLNNLRAVYSMGGGNQSILGALDDRGLKPDVYVAHDLDRENRELLEQRKIDFVLHHDLSGDIANAFRTFLSYHRLTSSFEGPTISTVNVVTAENIPTSSPHLQQRALL